MGGRVALLLGVAACLTVERSTPDPPHAAGTVDVHVLDLGPGSASQPERPVTPLAPPHEHTPDRVPYPAPANEDQGQPTIPDDVVIHVLDDYRSSFQSCVRRARKSDPTLGAVTIRLVVDVDADGTVVSADTDLEDRALASCVLNITRRLRFPPPNVRATAHIAFVAS